MTYRGHPHQISTTQLESQREQLEATEAHRIATSVFGLQPDAHVDSIREEMGTRVLSAMWLADNFDAILEIEEMSADYDDLLEQRYAR